jgi:D-beta-D-heptose 7-phosphate kinase / D-beta-D-heptose 1-phosphate adenosyltransferase
MTINELMKIVDQLKKEGKIIVFTNGCFDILHPGHIISLEWAKSQGDVLIVAINSDESATAIKRPPILLQNHRAYMLRALRCVDYVVVFNELTPCKILSQLRPHILVKGDKEVNVLGREYVNEIRLSPTLNNMSTSSLIGRIRRY